MVLTVALCALAAAAFASEAFQWVEFTNAMGVGVVYPDILTEGDEPYTDADVVHVYGIVRDGIVAEYRLGFPKAEAARFEAALKRMDESLKIAGE